MAGRPKGTPKTGGRAAGVPNKVNKELKDMIAGALDKAGGEDYLYRQALENPNAFLTLVGKILPKDVALSGSLDTTLTVQIVRYGQPDQGTDL
jgi:hypothetical protein